jgi:hypothetical protein
MNEADFVKKVTRHLQESGFYVKKLADSSTHGIPDSFLARDGYGMFIEFKLIRPAKIPKVLKSKSMWGKQIQLTTMLKLDFHFKARYIVGIDTGEGLSYAVVRPGAVLKLMQENLPITLHPVYPMKHLAGTIEHLLWD